MKETFRGIVHGFEAGRGLPCDIFPRGQGLEINSDSQKIKNITLSYSSMSVSLMGMDDAYIAFQTEYDGKTIKLLVSDKEIVSQIEMLGAPRQIIDALHNLVSNKSNRTIGRAAFLGLMVVVVIGLIWGGWKGVGYLAEKSTAFIPAEWETTLGKAAAEGILKEQKVCSDPELLRTVNEMGTRLVGALNTGQFNFKVRVLDSEEVNAFALPGGYVFINRGLLEQADDSFEVAGVLAHEIQHVILRHGINNVARQAGTMLLLSAFLGDVGGIEQFLLYNAASLATMSFNRDQERAADETGLELMYKAGMDPTGLPRFLSKLAEKEGSLSGALSMLSTHPASKERVTELNKLIAKKPEHQVIPLSADLKNISLKCEPIEMTDPDGAL